MPIPTSHPCLDAPAPAHPLRAAMGPTPGTPTSHKHVFAIVMTSATLPGMARGQFFQFRLSDEDKVWLEAAARKAGLKPSEYIRREIGLGKYRRADYQRIAKEPAPIGTAGQQEAESMPSPNPDHDQRVARAARLMPRKTAERVVRGEEARERAKAS
jgi:hypothetical protein